MTLPEVNLDDRSFQDLVSEARQRIAQVCPEWTEHNVSDPGITLVELFAWMTDMLIYRLNRVPEKLHVALLDLLGINLAPPAAASADVRFTLAAPAEIPLQIFARETEVATPRSYCGGPIVFQVRDDFTIAPVHLRAYAVEHGGQLRDVAMGDGEARPHGPDQRPFGTPPQPDDALYLGFSESLERLLLRVTVDALQARGAGVNPADPPLCWEVAQGDGSWARAEVLSDTTGGFNFGSGSIELQLPPRSMVVSLAGKRLYWLRCRLLGHGEPDGAVATYTQPPEIKSISAHTIGAEIGVSHARVEREEPLGYSDGTPAQSLQLLYRPALPLDPVTETLEVMDPDTGRWERWEPCDSFASSGAYDRHFTFDPSAAEIQLGPAIRHVDGSWTQHGAIPPKGAALRMTAYRHGGGRRGNVSAGAIDVLRTAIPGVASAINPQSAHGGLDPETLESGRRRATHELRVRHRAVTAADFEHLALEASHRVGRAFCVEGGPGAVAVNLLAAIDDPDRPLTAAELTPSADVVSQVAAHLDERRILGTTVNVGTVALRAVSVAVNVEARPQADLGRIESDVRGTLYRYLNPLIGGPDGGGWPFGRAVSLGELYGIVQIVPGVEQITLLRIYERERATGELSPRPVGDRLTLEPHELIASDSHAVRATRSREP